MSPDRKAMGTKVSVTGLNDVAVETRHLCPREYVAAIYNKWYIRCITAHNDTECDVPVKFMERRGQDILTFSWPQREDKHHISFVHVLCTVPAPPLYERSGQQYRLEHAVIYTVRKKLLQYIGKRKVQFHFVYTS
jgi:hypothetical protein